MFSAIRRVAGWKRGTWTLAVLFLGMPVIDAGLAHGETRAVRRVARGASPLREAASRPEAAALSQAGLAGIEAANDAEGRRIRGAYGGSWTSGMSFVAGMLFDPVTASSLRGSSANSSEAMAGPFRYLPSRAEQAQLSVLQLALSISQGGAPTFAGSLYGVANGSGFTRP